MKTIAEYDEFFAPQDDKPAQQVAWDAWVVFVFDHVPANKKVQMIVTITEVPGSDETRLTGSIKDPDAVDWNVGIYLVGVLILAILLTVTYL